MDFVSSGLINPSYRYFLAGENDYLKSFVIDRLSKNSGRRAVRVSTVKEMQPEGLFGSPSLWVLGSKSNPKVFQDFTVKVSKSKMGKTYKEAGFIEVTCSHLFPNQVAQFAGVLLAEKGMPKTYAKTIARLNKNDPYSIYNTIEALSYLDHKLTNEELIHYCGNLTTPDVFKMIDNFTEGNYNEFLNNVRESSINIHEILWALQGTLMRLQQTLFDSAFMVSWYQKKMLEAATKLAPYGFSKIIPYVNSMCLSYGQSREVLLLRLQRLIFHLSGVQIAL